MQEQEIIRRYFNYPVGSGGSGVTLGVGDDAAVLTPPAGQLVVSTDTLNGGVHFFADADPYLLARKAAAVSVSDIAAMGGRALWLTAALTAPATTASDWFLQFSRGLASSSSDYAYTVVGGDLTCGEQLSITTTVIGVCTTPPLTRAAAQVGDDVWVSGTIGAAAHALAVRLGTLPAAAAADMQAAEACLHNPVPRQTLAAALATTAHAMMDISDGLLLTAEEIAKQSAVAICLDAEAFALPASFVALNGEQQRQCQFVGGDDYELFFTAPAAAAEQIATLASAAKIAAPLSRIGKVSAGSGVTVQLKGQPLSFATSGYCHRFS